MENSSVSCVECMVSGEQSCVLCRVYGNSPEFCAECMVSGEQSSVLCRVNGGWRTVQYLVQSA